MEHFDYPERKVFYDRFASEKQEAGKRGTNGRGRVSDKDIFIDILPFDSISRMRHHQSISNDLRISVPFFQRPLDWQSIPSSVDQEIADAINAQELDLQLFG
jgi:hypothetical protein